MALEKLEFTERVTFWTTDEGLVELQALAKAEGQTVSGMLRVLVSRAAQHLRDGLAVTKGGE